MNNTPRRLLGRKQIFTNAEIINRGNVVQVLNDALHIHTSNRADMEYLYNYRRGDQPILYRVKDVRPEICNRIVVNRANEIVTFKTANFIGEPLQYVSRGANSATPGKIEKLNSMMMSEGKSSKDMSLADWMFTTGVGYRLVLNDKADSDELYDEAPFEIYTLDPRNTFVVRRNDVTRKPIMAVNYVYLSDAELVETGKILYTVYTQNQVFRIEGSINSAGAIKKVETHNFGMIPIIEYPCNALRMGAFEVVIDLLDALNLIESNRIDGVEQFIQAMMVFKNVEVTMEQVTQLKELGAISLPPNSSGHDSDLYYLCEQLDQSQTQILADALYQEVLQIVGMPSQGNANTADSSNNGAVIMKNGWWNAEACAKETEGMWRESESEFLKVVLKICHEANVLDLKVSDIEQKFLRRSYEDKLTKVQSFTSLIAAGAPPIQAFTISGVVVDPESAATVYEDYQDKQDEKLNQHLADELNKQTAVNNSGGQQNEPVQSSGRGDNDSESENDTPVSDGANQSKKRR
jgi:SPP1 family phage portal protein